MTTQFKDGDNVPNSVLADRLDALADAVTKGPDAVRREFTMRVPAELDRDADLVMSEAAKRLRALSAQAMTEEQVGIESPLGLISMLVRDLSVAQQYMPIEDRIFTNSSIKLACKNLEEHGIEADLSESAFPRQRAEPVATVANNNQPGQQHIIETAPNVTLPVGTKLYAAPVLRQLPGAVPEAVTVPEEAYPDDCPDLYASQPDAWAEGFNACRKLMLEKAASPAPSHPAPGVPEGMVPIADCPNCPNQGWYVRGYEPEMEQCEFCYTVPNSRFNLRDVINASPATDTGKPSWEDAPEGARWLGQTDRGDWWWFESDEKPQPSAGGFSIALADSASYAGPGCPNPNWRNTLEQRPAPDTEDKSNGL